MNFIDGDKWKTVFETEELETAEKEFESYKESITCDSEKTIYYIDEDNENYD